MPHCLRTHCPIGPAGRSNGLCGAGQGIDSKKKNKKKNTSITEPLGTFEGSILYSNKCSLSHFKDSLTKTYRIVL